ncbi:MAG: glycoside hydrolase family 18 [Clostridium sp.]|nr:glycoside hydrolase family 18 [Bacteroides sp.]MCM1198670.1 glycoside hydrolase family 18 [Clostridium sp.]
MKRTIILAFLTMASCSCSKWTEPRLVEYPNAHPWDTDPSAWAEYTASLRAYRTEAHRTIYVRFDNAPEAFSSEKYSLRCIADSVDIVSLTNSRNISQNDIADLPFLHEKGIKVLYQLDYASRSEELKDKSALNAALDEAVSTVERLGLDGWSFTGIYKRGDNVSQEAASAIFDRLNAAKSDSQLLVFEGDPQFVAEKDRRKLDYVVLNTEGIQRTGSISLLASSAVTIGVPANRLILAAEYGTVIIDDDDKETDAVGEMAKLLSVNARYAGLAVYNVSEDYYSPDGNYLVLRSAINLLNGK